MVISVKKKLTSSGDYDVFDRSEVKDLEDNDLYERAVQATLSTGKVSTQFLQRELGIGYSKAARFLEIMEERKIISKSEGKKPRHVIVKSLLK